MILCLCVHVHVHVLPFMPKMDFHSGIKPHRCAPDYERVSEHLITAVLAHWPVPPQSLKHHTYSTHTNTHLHTPPQAPNPQINPSLHKSLSCSNTPTSSILLGLCSSCCSPVWPCPLHHRPTWWLPHFSGLSCCTCRSRRPVRWDRCHCEHLLAWWSPGSPACGPPRYCGPRGEGTPSGSELCPRPEPSWSPTDLDGGWVKERGKFVHLKKTNAVRLLISQQCCLLLLRNRFLISLWTNI